MLAVFVLSAALAQAAAAVEPIAITTPDGARLAARFFDAGPGAPAVLFFPMCSPGAADGWTPVADALRRAGVSSLISSYRTMPGNTAGTATGDTRLPDAAAALALLRSRIGAGAPVAFAGSSCGVAIALGSAAAHAPGTRAVVALSGPYSTADMEHVRATAGLAIFSGASAAEPPSPDWARALADASAHPASRVVIVEQGAHGTDQFRSDLALAQDIAGWLVARLTEAPAR